MKSRTLVALAVASTFACAGAFAGGAHHGANMSLQSSYEVQTPSSVNESAPWLANHAALPAGHSESAKIGFQEGQFSDGPVGTSAWMSGSGSGGYDSTSTSATEDLSMSSMQTFDSGDSFTYVEYWLLGDEPSGTGRSSSNGGSGGGGFDSHAIPDVTSMGKSDSRHHAYNTSWGDPLSFVTTRSADEVAVAVGEQTSLLSEHYLVYGPISEFDGQNVIVLELGPGAEDTALLDALSRDFYVLTPISDEGS